MPKSRTRAAKPRAVRGIPASVLAQAPPSLTAAQKAQWADAYQAGATERPWREPRGSAIGHQLRRAHDLGRRVATDEETRALADRKKARTAGRRRPMTIADSRPDIMLRLDRLAYLDRNS